MLDSPSPPLAEKEWPTADEPSSGRSPRDPDARSDQRTGMRPRRSSNQPVYAFGRNGDQVASDRPSIGRRIWRALVRFFLTVLIGVGATLAWQSYGDAGREMMVARAPTLAWLLSISAAKSPAVAATSPNLAPLLEPLASDLDIVRRSVGQLVAKQEQMAQNIAALQAVEEDIRQKMSFTPPSSPAPVQQAAPTLPHRTPRPTTQPAQSSSVSRPPPPAGQVSIPR